MVSGGKIYKKTVTFHKCYIKAFVVYYVLPILYISSKKGDNVEIWFRKKKYNYRQSNEVVWVYKKNENIQQPNIIRRYPTK